MSGWVRSSRCGGNGECIRVRVAGEHIDIQHDNGVSSYLLRVPRAEWDAFAAGIKNGDFDNLQEGTSQ